MTLYTYEDFNGNELHARPLSNGVEIDAVERRGGTIEVRVTAEDLADVLGGIAAAAGRDVAAIIDKAAKDPGPDDLPLHRGHAMKRTRLRRLTPLRRTGHMPRRLREMRKRYRDTGPDTQTRMWVWWRAGNTCERCGLDSISMDVHHRQPRGLGGSSDPAINAVSNLVLLCRPCHAEIESARLAAIADGWLVPRPTDPVRVPIHHRRGLTLLTPTGDYAWRH